MLVLALTRLNLSQLTLFISETEIRVLQPIVTNNLEAALPLPYQVILIA
jgi:hypothetical protein